MRAFLTLALLSTLRLGQTPVAPDGHRSLGSQAPIAELVELFRKPTPEDEAFLRGLAALEGELGILAETARGLYSARDYLDLLPLRAEDSLEAFHAQVVELFAAPEPFLAQGKGRGRLWASILLDTRLRVRAEVLAGWRADAAQVARGIALLRAGTDGWVRLDDAEGRIVAGRVDLAGALLRARIKDLAALREQPGSPAEVRAEDLERLLSVVAQAPGPERQARLDQELIAAEALVPVMRSVLFTTRLREEALDWIRWREGLDAEAERLRAEVRTWRPDTAEGREASGEIRRQRKTPRRREALVRALAGLAHDPLDDELAFAAGRMAEYVSGVLHSVDYYDRFLALRGLRVFDLGQRELTRDEKHAVFQIQQFETQLERR